MTLQQLNLKLPPAVIAHWRSQAAAAGLSVRDWLLAELAPPAAATADRVSLADRVAQLEATTAALQEALVQLQTRPAPRPVRSPRPAPVTPLAAPDAPPAELPAGGIETAALAQLLGVKRGTLNARIARAGGAAPGLVIDGWRCLDLRTPERGGPPRARWVPADS